MDMMAMAGADIGLKAVQSYLSARSARKQAATQSALQKAQHYQNQTREYASLTQSVKAQGRQNEAIVQSELYNFSNTLSNIGAMEFRDAQLRGVMARNKLQLKTDGMTSKASAAAQAGAVGAVGASVMAMQQDVDRKVNEAIADVSAQRVNQQYDKSRQQEVMWASFYQNQVEIDDSKIDEAFLPQDMIEIGGGSRGGFLPHLVGAALGFGAQELQRNFALGLSESNSKGVPPLELISQPMYDSPIFKESQSRGSRAYAYR